MIDADRKSELHHDGVEEGRIRKVPSRAVRRARRHAPAWLGPAYLRARSALVRQIEARLPARGHLAADFLDLPRVKDSRGNRKHFPIFNRDVTLI